MLFMCLSGACHHNGCKQYWVQVNFASFLLFLGSTLTTASPTKRGNLLNTWQKLGSFGGWEWGWAESTK